MRSVVLLLAHILLAHAKVVKSGVIFLVRRHVFGHPAAIAAAESFVTIFAFFSEKIRFSLMEAIGFLFYNIQREWHFDFTFDNSVGVFSLVIGILFYRLTDDDSKYFLWFIFDVNLCISKKNKLLFMATIGNKEFRMLIKKKSPIRSY